MTLAVVVSFRLGGGDGVSVEAAKWVAALRSIGYQVSTIAGEGRADVLVEGLGIGPQADGADGASSKVDLRALRLALQDASLVVIENVCSLPLNPGASDALAKLLAGRPAILRHHDLAWQRRRFANHPPPPHDPAWAHVTINDISRRQMAKRGIAAVTMHNRFALDGPVGDRSAAREALGLEDDDLLVVQPTRAIERKGIDVGVSLAEALGATYWLVGRPEEGYGPRASEILSKAKVRTHWGPLDFMGASSGIEHAYAAADVIAFPSHREGFGNPPVEAAVHRVPVAVGRYKMTQELAGLGFWWFDALSPSPLARWLAHRDTHVTEHNRSIVERHLDLAKLPEELATLIVRSGWSLPR